MAPNGLPNTHPMRYHKGHLGGTESYPMVTPKGTLLGATLGIYSVTLYRHYLLPLNRSN